MEFLVGWNKERRAGGRAGGRAARQVGEVIGSILAGGQGRRGQGERSMAGQGRQTERYGMRRTALIAECVRP